jgi:hypothetical protein
VNVLEYLNFIVEPDQVYLRPQGDLRLIVSHGEIAVHMLANQPQLFPDILDVLVKLQVCQSKVNAYIYATLSSEFLL